MKSRIKAKFLVVIALMTLVLNVCGSFSSLFVQAETTSSGYQIDVSYQDGYAQLTANTKQLRQGYKLVSLTGSDGQQYDPYKFSQKISQNGTYSYTLSYMLDGISSEAKTEVVTVNVDKLAKSASTTGLNVPTLSLAQVQARAAASTQSTVDIDVYPAESYNPKNPESAKSIGKINIPNGIFEDNKESIDSVISSKINVNRFYKFATIVRSGDGKEVHITGIWSNNGKTYYSVDDTTNANDEIGVAYEASAGDKIRMYASLTGKEYSLDVSDLLMKEKNGDISNLTIAPSPNDGNQTVDVVASAGVVVSFDWNHKYEDASVNYNNTALIKDTAYDKDARHYVGKFNMPNNATKLMLSLTPKTSNFQFSVYNNSSTYYQSYELGYTTVGLTSLSNPNNINGYSKVYRWQGDINGGNNLNIYTTADNKQEWRTVKGNTMQGKVDNVNVTYPYQSQAVGTTVVAKYESKRGVPADMKGVFKKSWIQNGASGLYKYTVPLQGRLDILSSTNQSKYTSNYFKLYQSQADYNASSSTVKYEASLNKAVAGMYPVQTTLADGTQITSYPQQYDTKSKISEYDSKNWISQYYFEPLIYYSFIIVIKNAYDNIRLVLGSGASTANNWYQAAAGDGVVSVKGSGDTSSYVTNSNATASSNNRNVGTAYVGNGGGSGSLKRNPPIYNGNVFTFYRAIPKPGYTTPKPNMTVRDNSSNTTFSVSDVTNDTTYSANKNSFITGFLGTNTPFYSKEDGAFNYSLYIQQSNGSMHSVTFSSKPVNFSVKYENLNGFDSNNHTVDNGNYFAIPQKNPTLTSGKHFKGWELYATGNGLDSSGKVKLTSGSTKDGLYSPGDLISVVDLFNELKSHLTSASVDMTQVSLQFSPVIGTGSNTVASGKIKVGQYLQNTVNGYSGTAQKDKELTVLEGTNVQITGISNEISINNIKFYKNMSKSDSLYIPKFTPGENPLLVNVKYDKGITVVYKDGQGKIVQAPNDAAKYNTTVVGNNDTINLPDENGLTSMGISVPKGKKFGGWQVVTNDTAATSLKTFVKSSNGIIAVTLSDPLIANTAFTKGSVVIQPLWEDNAVAIKTASGGVGGDTKVNMADEGKWISLAKGKKEFTISGKFKYGNSTGTSQDNAAYQKAKTDGKIFYALYKQDPTKDGAESADTVSYALWKATKNQSRPNANKVKNVEFSSSLDSNGCFTITATIQDVGDSISYRWDNNANYSIYCWSPANNVNGDFNTDGSLATSIINNKTGTSHQNIPSTTTTTRVLEPLVLAAGQGTMVSGTNTIDSKKLVYTGDALNISFDVTTSHVYPIDQIKNSLKYAITKQENGESIQKVWYSSDIGITNEGGKGSTKKYTDIVVTQDTSNANKYHVTVSGISDEPNSNKLSARWSSGAKYFLYVWNDSNDSTPTVSKNNGKDVLNNTSSVPGKVYSIYVVDSSKNDSKYIPDKLISYPSSVNLQETSDSKIVNKSEALTVQMHSVWNKYVGGTSPYQQQVDTDIKPEDANSYHDYAYDVSLTGANISISDGVKLNLMQSGTQNSLKVDVLKYMDTGTFMKLTNTKLGTLGFTASGQVSKLRFGLEADKPKTMSKNSYSGTIEYTFVRNSLTNVGGGS